MVRSDTMTSAHPRPPHGTIRTIRIHHHVSRIADAFAHEADQRAIDDHSDAQPRSRHQTQEPPEPRPAPNRYSPRHDAFESTSRVCTRTKRIGHGVAQRKPHQPFQIRVIAKPVALGINESCHRHPAPSNGCGASASSRCVANIRDQRSGIAAGGKRLDARHFARIGSPARLWYSCRRCPRPEQTASRFLETGFGQWSPALRSGNRRGRYPWLRPGGRTRFAWAQFRS